MYFYKFIYKIHTFLWQRNWIVKWKCVKCEILFMWRRRIFSKKRSKWNRIGISVFRIKQHSLQKKFNYFAIGNLDLDVIFLLWIINERVIENGEARRAPWTEIFPVEKNSKDKWGTISTGIKREFLVYLFLFYYGKDWLDA